jgi:hypothetical protein
MSPNSGGTSPSLALNRSVVQSGGRDAGKGSGMTAVRSETSEYLDLNSAIGYGEETSPSLALKIQNLNLSLSAFLQNAINVSQVNLMIG